MLALATALIIYSRHATDHEHIALMDGYLLIEKVEAGKVEIIHLDPHWTRILQPERYQDLIGLISNGKKIEIGRFISGNKRKHLARELQHQLQYVG